MAPTGNRSTPEEIRKLIDQYISENRVMIFSKSWCPYCKKIKQALGLEKIAFNAIELDLIEQGEDIEKGLIEKTGQETVPNIFVESEHIGGCDDTLEAMRTGRLQHLLESKSPEGSSDSGQFEGADYDLIVVGGGSGGLACSKEARSLGASVLVLDYVQPTPIGTTWGLGGTCVNVGCIPKKLMHQSALIGDFSRDSTDFGWKPASSPETTAKHDWSTLVSSVQNYIRSLNFKYRTDLRSKGVVYENAFGEFVSPHKIRLTYKNGQSKEVTGRRFVVAVGGRPKYGEIPGDKEYGISSDDLFSLDYDPGKTIVIGASYVALECAGFLHGIGREVQVFVRSILLRGFDQQMASKIGEFMSKIGIEFRHRTIPTRVECLEQGKPGKLRVHYRQTLESGETLESFEDCNTVLFAVGREACTTKLALDKIGVQLDKSNGFKIRTNKEQSIDVPWLYAIGDCIDEQSMPAGQALELTPVAIQAGILLARRLFSSAETHMDYWNVPTTIFTPIEYGSVGYSEENALLKFGQENIEVYHSEFVPLEWSISQNRSPVKAMCYAKLIVNKTTDRVVGLHVLSPNAGEITQGYAVAIRMGARKQDFDMTVGIHPTCSEIFTTLTKTKSSGESAEQGGC